MKSFFNRCAVIGVVLALFVSSCTAPRHVSYVMDMNYEQPEQATPAPDLRIQPHDMLNILVASNNPQLSAPFNFVSGNTNVPSTEYLVDSGGCIDFPILGTLRVEGKTTGEIRDAIAKQIEDNGYIREPVVKVTLKNFQVTVIGRTGNKVLDVENGQMNILQAIAKSGELGASSKMKDVMVIRTENGQRRAYSINLQSKSLFESPAYHLQQNDIVYVKPRGSRLAPETQAFLTVFNTGLSVVSILTNYIIWTVYRR